MTDETKSTANPKQGGDDDDDDGGLELHRRLAVIGGTLNCACINSTREILKENARPSVLKSMLKGTWAMQQLFTVIT